MHTGFLTIIRRNVKSKPHKENEKASRGRLFQFVGAEVTRLQFSEWISEPPHLGSCCSRLRRAFADLKAHETADGDFVAKLLGDLGGMFLHAHLGVAFYEALVHEAISLVKLF